MALKKRKAKTSKLSTIAGVSAVAGIALSFISGLLFSGLDYLKFFHKINPESFETINDAASLVNNILIAGCMLSSVIFGIAAIIEIKKSEEKLDGLSIAIASICFGLLPVTIYGVLYLSGIMGRLQRHELSVLLVGIGLEEEKYHRNNEKYSAKFDEFLPDGEWLKPQTYSYFLSLSESAQAATGGPYSLPPRIKAFVEKDKFQIIAVSNLDRDEVLDVWMVNEFDPGGKVLIVDDLKYNKWSEVNLKNINNLR